MKRDIEIEFTDNCCILNIEDPYTLIQTPPAIKKPSNKYPCKDCGGYGLHRASSTGMHYYKCSQCDNKTMYAPLESICRFDWAFENTISKQCIECNDVLIKTHEDICLLCLEPICKNCSCSNCETIKV